MFLAFVDKEHIQMIDVSAFRDISNRKLLAKPESLMPAIHHSFNPPALPSKFLRKKLHQSTVRKVWKLHSQVNKAEFPICVSRPPVGPIPRVGGLPAGGLGGLPTGVTGPAHRGMGRRPTQRGGGVKVNA